MSILMRFSIHVYEVCLAYMFFTLVAVYEPHCNMYTQDTDTPISIG